MKVLPRFQSGKKRRPTVYSLVDIGRDTVKAAIIRLVPDSPEIQVIGYGLVATGGHDITGGRLEAAAVTAPVNEALTQAEDSTEATVGRKVVPDDVIFALAGRATAGKLFTIHQTRPRSTQPVTAKELASLRSRAERLVRQGLSDLPVEGGQWQALAVTDAGIQLDHRLALEGLGLTGREITFSVFGVAAQAGALRALRVLANRLDLEVANVVAASQALAALTPSTEAIILDTGLSGTDICLIRNNALVAAGSIPFGGAFFTQALAQAMQLEPAEAEKLKRDVGLGKLSPERAELVDCHLRNARARWYKAALEFLVRSAGEWPLPRKIYLTGGGNLLPGLDKLLCSNPDPFERPPEVLWLGSHLSVPIKDLTNTLDYKLFTLTLSLTAGLPE
ncbi:MAG: pilus assembly protein PilM [Anaerolineae bacterium]